MMCRVLNVSTGGYYAWKKRKPSAQQQRREQFTDAVETFHEDSKGAYGYRKIHEDIIEGFDVPCCLETVRRSLKSEWLRDKIFQSHEAATSATFGYIKTFYNPKRRHAALGYQSPIQYENNMKLQQPLAA